MGTQEEYKFRTLGVKIISQHSMQLRVSSTWASKLCRPSDDKKKQYLTSKCFIHVHIKQHREKKKDNTSALAYFIAALKKEVKFSTRDLASPRDS